MKYPFRDECLLAFCRLGPAGLMPKAPGTWGTALACLIAPFVYLPLDYAWRAILLAVLFLAGGFAGTRAEKLLGMTDPSEVVIDELVGVWLAMLPFRDLGILGIVLAFILFRIFDILKPWPVHASESWLPGGFGIMIDDVVAGLYAMGCLYLLKYADLF